MTTPESGFSERLSSKPDRLSLPTQKTLIPSYIRHMLLSAHCVYVLGINWGTRVTGLCVLWEPLREVMWGMSVYVCVWGGVMRD